MARPAPPRHPARRPRRAGIGTTGLAALVLLLTACGGPVRTGSGTIPVVASTNVYGAIAKAVGGDRVSVTSIIADPSADPHSHEATPAEAAKVAAARLVVVNGGGYDDFMPRLVESSGGRPAVLDAVGVSGLAPAGTSELNEHVWYDLTAVQKIASRLADDLGAADPAHAAEFTAKANAFNERIGGLLARAMAIGTAHPGARVAVTEPVPGYLLAAAGLTDATPKEFSAAVEEDTDPPAAVVAQTLALFGGPDPVRALAVNAQTRTPTTDQVRQAATAAGVPVVEVTETLPPGATGYVEWMGGQIDALARALDRT